MLKPQSPARVDWEQRVCFELETLLECDTSDAQGLMMVCEAEVDRCYAESMDPAQAAQALDRASLGQS